MQEVASKYVGKPITVSFLGESGGSIIGSMVHVELLECNGSLGTLLSTNLKWHAIAHLPSAEQ